VNTTIRGVVLAVAGLAACGKPPANPMYEAVAVQRRTLVVSASASGAIEPVLTLDVKSKASGEIIAMNVQTGDDVKPDQLLASIDPRIPRNNLAQAEANLVVAQAQLEAPAEPVLDARGDMEAAPLAVVVHVEGIAERTGDVDPQVAGGADLPRELHSI